jgi:hypothetical protein
MEKKLYCVVVTDPNDTCGMEFPTIFHIRTTSSDLAEAKVNEELSSPEGDYEFDQDDINSLDIFTFEVTDLDILEA